MLLLAKTENTYRITLLKGMSLSSFINWTDKLYLICKYLATTFSLKQIL